MSKKLTEDMGSLKGTDFHPSQYRNNTLYVRAGCQCGYGGDPYSKLLTRNLLTVV